MHRRRRQENQVCKTPVGKMGGWGQAGGAPAKQYDRWPPAILLCASFPADLEVSAEETPHSGSEANHLSRAATTHRYTSTWSGAFREHERAPTLKHMLRQDIAVILSTCSSYLHHTRTADCDGVSSSFPFFLTQTLHPRGEHRAPPKQLAMVPMKKPRASFIACSHGLLPTTLPTILHRDAAGYQTVALCIGSLPLVVVIKKRSRVFRF